MRPYFEAFPQAEWTEGQHAVAGDTGLSTWRFIGTTAGGAAVDVQGLRPLYLSTAI